MVSTIEATREIYWNVGSAVLVPMYLLAFLSIAVIVFGFLKRRGVYKLGKPVQRTDDIEKRVASFIKGVIFQTKVIRSSLPGLAHGFFFWGFLILFIGTTLVFIQADFTDPLFGYRFLKGGFYKLFSLALDIAGLVAITAMAGLFIRRFIVRPEGLESSKDDLIMHFLLFSVLVTGFFVEGFRMAVTEVPQNMALAYYSPVGLAVAAIFSGIDDVTLRVLHERAWWIHFLFTIGFFISIPFTKFRHIFTTPVNYVFEDRRPKGSIDSPDLEDEQADSFGAASIKDLTWKDIFDSDACTLCKRCQDRCPAYATGKPLSPMKLVNQIQDASFHNPDTNLIDLVARDVLWACTTCGACQEICPASIEHVNKILEMRRNLVLMEGEFPGDEVQSAVESTEVNGNPLGMAPASRGNWADGLSGIKIMRDDPNVDVLYFVGCYASFDKRNISVAQSFVKLCGAAGITVGILGKEEKCCGEPVRKIGNEYLYQTTAKENIELIKSYGVKKIVTACPHCFNTINRDYRDFGLDADVGIEHHTVFLNRLLKEGRIKLEPEPFNCTYHDSCYIGRYNDIYQKPRSLVKASGGAITEMPKSFSESFCCGAGGGRIIADEKIGTRINASRVKMAHETKAEILVSNCPFCLTMFEDGIKTAELDGKLLPRDIAEIMTERLER